MEVGTSDFSELANISNTQYQGVHSAVTGPHLINDMLRELGGHIVRLHGVQSRGSLTDCPLPDAGGQVD